MISLEGLLLLIIALPNIALGGLILARNFRDTSNVFFSMFAFSVSFWSMGLAFFIFSNPENTAILWARVYYLAAALIAPAFLYFVLSFTGKLNRLPLAAQYAPAAPTAILAAVIIIFPNFLIEGLAYRDWGKEILLDGFGYSIYSLYFVGYVLLGFIILLRRLLASDGQPKIYLKVLFFGFLVAFALGMTFNLIYPALGNYRYIWAGPMFTVSYIMLISYAIVRHRLFDIRLVLARTLGYILSVLILGAVFGVIAFELLSLLIFNEIEVSLAQRVAYIILFVIFAMLFHPLKRFFDFHTTKIFYRDSYETQELLDRFNEVIVSTIDLDQLLLGTEKTVLEFLKIDTLSFAIRNQEDDVLRFVSQSQEDGISSVIEEVRKIIHGDQRRIFLTDSLKEGELKRLLKKANIGLLTRMTSDGTFEGNGYAVLGHKKSGNIYNQQDVSSLEIIANELSIAIQNAMQFEEIQKFNVTLQKKIDDATKELQQSNDKLKALDEAKDEFVSMASHQLRTPLTSIKGYVSMVQEEDVGKLNEQQKKMLGQAMFSSQRMVYLISDLLNVSRLKTGKFVIETKPISLPGVIESEVRQLKDGAAAKDITLAYQKPKEFPVLSLDEMKIRQVIMNFTDNAIYYTPNGGKITLELKDKKESIEFTVKDTGIGVPKEERHKLFTKFYRADNAKKARPDGTGLGLFMAKKVIIAQGGSVIFDSVEGKGSTFGFSFPKQSLLVTKNDEDASQLKKNDEGEGQEDDSPEPEDQ